MTYSVKTLYPQFKCLTAHRAIMKRIETAGKRFLNKDLNGCSPVRRQIANLIFRDLKYVDKRISRDYSKQEVELTKLSNKADFGKKFVELFKEVQSANRKPYGFYFNPPPQKNIISKWEETNHKLKKDFPFLFSKNKNDNYKSFGYNGYYMRDLNYAWKKYKNYEMMDYAKKGEFYEAMLKRDEVLGMANSLPDEIVGEIFGFL